MTDTRTISSISPQSHTCWISANVTLTLVVQLMVVSLVHCGSQQNICFSIGLGPTLMSPARHKLMEDSASKNPFYNGAMRHSPHE